MKIKGVDIGLLLYGFNHVKTIGNGRVVIHPTAKLRRTRIYVYPGASLTIKDNCRLKDAHIFVGKGEVILENNVIVEETDISVERGTFKMGHHVKLACRKVWIRFGGETTIGCYTNVNSGTEIRCDEKVVIGSFNQISYNVRIWDTNTHQKLSKDMRRYVTESHFPYFGFEDSRPETAPVIIGDDCWIGESVAILKGSVIGDASIIGFGTLIAGKEIPAHSRAINQQTLIISKI